MIVSVLDRPGRRLFLLRLWSFGIVSATGLALDVGGFSLLVHIAHMGPLPANLISATVAVTFVFFVSARHVFRSDGHLLIIPFMIYLIYQAIAVSLASVAVAWLCHAGVLPILSKIAILPVTFIANFLVMARLTRNPRTAS